MHERTHDQRVIAPPPLIYAATLLVGIGVHLWAPLRFFSETWVGHAAGWPPLTAALLVGLWAVRAMSRAGEHPDFGRPTGTVVTSGPFAYSRNPLYLSLTLVYVGIALVVNTAWPVIFLPVAVGLTHYGVIIREEHYLERRLGDEYLRYRARVRRWF